jgi:hypothetical protein
VTSTKDLAILLNTAVTAIAAVLLFFIPIRHHAERRPARDHFGEIPVVNLYIGEQSEITQAALGQAGFKFAAGGSHISRTLMLAETRTAPDNFSFGCAAEF